MTTQLVLMKEKPHTEKEKKRTSPMKVILCRVAKRPWQGTITNGEQPVTSPRGTPSMTLSNHMVVNSVKGLANDMPRT
jgi:hypothetical protein